MSEAIPFRETRAKAAEQLAGRYMALLTEPDAGDPRRDLCLFASREQRGSARKPVGAPRGCSRPAPLAWMERRRRGREMCPWRREAAHSRDGPAALAFLSRAARLQRSITPADSRLASRSAAGLRTACANRRPRDPNRLGGYGPNVRHATRDQRCATSRRAPSSKSSSSAAIESRTKPSPAAPKAVPGATATPRSAISENAKSRLARPERVMSTQR
jgi:hypothetical protein